MIAPTNLPEVSKKTTDKKVKKAISLITTSTELEANPTALGVIEECCRKAGVTLELIYSVLHDGLKATIPTEKVVDGMVIAGDVPDYNVRHKYMLTSLELIKHLKDKNVVAMTGIFNDPTIQEDAQRILSLRGRVLDG